MFHELQEGFMSKIISASETNGDECSGGGNNVFTVRISLSLSCTTAAMMKIQIAQSIFRPDVKPLYR